MSSKISRSSYSEMYGPTTGDKVRLADTDLIIEVENDSSIWLGGLSPDGFIQVYDLKNNLSISKFDFDLTEIIDISIADSICFIAFIDNQDWGVMEFIVSDNKWIYRDIYRNWPINFDSINSIESPKTPKAYINFTRPKLRGMSIILTNQNNNVKK